MKRNERKLKIAISGSFSVGKTTLVNALYESISEKYDVGIAEEIALSMIKQGFKLSNNITEYGIINYALRSLQNIHSNEWQLYISDRSLIDLYAYISLTRSEKVRMVYPELIKEILHYESSYFDYYIYIPIEIPLIAGNQRPADIKYREEVDRQIKDLLEVYNCRIVTVTGSVEQRRDTVIKLIEDWYGNEK